MPRAAVPAASRCCATDASAKRNAARSPSAIAAKVIVVIAPGGYLADPAQYPYRRLRPGVRLRPLGPHFEGRKA